MIIKYMDLNCYENALFFAYDAHSNQLMSFPKNAPYILHCVGVANIALTASSKVEDLNINLVAQVALLHDILEDTNVTYEELSKKFGSEVADGVLALTKNKELRSREAMIDSINRIKKQSKEIAIVKLADRTFNLRCFVPKWSDEKKVAYVEEAKIILKELGYASSYLSNKLQERIDERLKEFYGDTPQK